MMDRVRETDEIRDKIEAVSVDSVLEFLQAHSLEDFTVVTIGSKEVTI